MTTLLSAVGGQGGGTPFGIALLEILWTTITSPPPRGGDASSDHRGGGAGGGASWGWAADVVSAHVECATFLLLKLPPPPPPSPSPLPEAVSSALGEGQEEEEGEGDKFAVTDASGDVAADDDKTVAAAAATGGGDSGSGAEHELVARSVSAATENLAKAVRSFVLDEDEEAAAAAAAATAAAGGLRDRTQSAARRKSKASSVNREDFSRAFGQLHLGAEKGAGVMSSVSGSATVWGALLHEFKRALDQR